MLEGWSALAFAAAQTRRITLGTMVTGVHYRHPGSPRENDESPYAGRHFQLQRPLNSPPSVRRPHPPVLIGGGGEKKTLRLVARYADACNLFDSPELPHKLEVLREHCEREGRDQTEIEKTALHALSEDATVGQAVDAVGRLGDAGIEHVIFSRPTAHQPGAVAMLAEVVAQLPER